MFVKHKCPTRTCLVRSPTNAQPINEQNTYYGCDGDHLVQIKSSTGTTHIVYEDEYSFTPLIELYQPACAQPEEQSEAQEAIACVMNSLAQLGIEEVRELQQQIKEQAESILRQSELREEEDEGERESKYNPDAGQIRYFHCDQIGAPLALTDDKGQIIWAGRMATNGTALGACGWCVWSAPDPLPCGALFGFFFSRAGFSSALFLLSCGTAVRALSAYFLETQRTAWR